MAAAPALAELQQVEVGGSVRIRGDYIRNVFVSPPPVKVRWTPGLLLGRPIGGPFNPAVGSAYSWDNRERDLSIVEQRTRLHVKADFTDAVSAFIELDSYDIWGEDFRSNYITGIDGRAASVDDVEIFQAYIDARELWGTPLSLRVGRQELAFGSQWMLGPRDNSFLFTGISFDAVRLTYAQDDFSIDVFASKVAERFGDFGDDDTDLYGVFASYTGVNNMVFDAYWLYLRDDVDIEDVAGGPLTELIEGWWGVDDYGATNLHTVGLRAAGRVSQFDFDVEAAYQFGDAHLIGTTFKPFRYGDDDARFDNFALKLDAGYTFDVKYQPRLFLGFRYYGGEDNRDISFLDWLNPFYRPKASVSFNRLYSNDIASGFFDANNDLSNAWYGRLGVMGHPAEKVWMMLAVTYYEAVEPFDAPRHFWIGKARVPIAPALSFWTQENSDELGWEVTLFGTYSYSDDLIFEAGWTHLFPGDGLRDGSYSAWNGLAFNGGSDDDGADYAYLGCKLFF